MSEINDRKGLYLFVFVIVILCAAELFSWSASQGSMRESYGRVGVALSYFGFILAIAGIPIALAVLKLGKVALRIARIFCQTTLAFLVSEYAVSMWHLFSLTSAVNKWSFFLGYTIAYGIALLTFLSLLNYASRKEREMSHAE